MTASRTEERLREALGATADVIPDTALAPGVPARARLTGRRSVLVLAGAVGAVAVGGGVPAYVATRRSGLGDDTWAQGTGLTSIPPAEQPPYFLARERASVDSYLTQIRDSRTGALVDTLPGVHGYFAAAPDQRTFYLVRPLERPGGKEGDWNGQELVRIRIGESGKITGTDVLPDTKYHNERENDATLVYQQLAVSPDGRWLAYTGDRGIGVVDPETGQRRAWAMPWQWTVRSPSWTPDGKTITFLNEPMYSSGQPRPSGEIRALDLAEDVRLADSRRVTKDDLIELPRIGRGFFVDAVTEANGRSALAIFATGLAQGEARALVRIDLRSGAISVVDGKLKEQHIGEIAYDASRRHRLVITGQYAWSGPYGVVRSSHDGKLLPLSKTRNIEAIAW